MKYVFILMVFILQCLCTNPVDVQTGTPRVTYHTPAVGEVAVAINRKVTIVFSQQMDSATLTTENLYVMDGPVTVAGTLSFLSSSVTFTPVRNLTPNTVYMVTISGKVKDVSGNALKEPQSWKFTTGENADTVEPSINSLYPANASMGIAVDRKISATFSESVDSAGIQSSTFTLRQDTNEIPGIITCLGKIVTFVPVHNLEPDKTYTVILTKDIADLAGNRMTHGQSWSFTTGNGIDGQSPVSLGSAARYAILSDTVLSGGLDSVIGNIGSFSDSGVSGFGFGDISGTVISGSSATAKVFAEMDSAYTGLTIRPATSPGLSEADLGGKVFTPGVHRFSLPIIIDTDDLILNAQGDPNAIFVFQTSQALLVTSGRSVLLSKGAQAGNIFWCVDSAKIGGDSKCAGTILANRSITINSGAILDGRAFSRQGTVRLDTCTVRRPAP